jgi:periplasmic divalent cation tolerance protein
MTKEYETKKYVKFIEVHITCPNMETAERIANSIVSNKYAACVQIMDLAKSVYVWNGKIEKEKEILLIAKTR